MTESKLFNEMANNLKTLMANNEKLIYSYLASKGLKEGTVDESKELNRLIPELNLFASNILEKRCNDLGVNFDNKTDLIEVVFTGIG